MADSESPRPLIVPTLGAIVEVGIHALREVDGRLMLLREAFDKASSYCPRAAASQVAEATRRLDEVRIALRHALKRIQTIG